MSMTVQSLKIIGENSLDLEQTQALKLGGCCLKNKMTDINVFQSCALESKINTGNLNLMPLMVF